MDGMSSRIRELRKYYRLSRDEFGERLGVSRDVIANIELNRLANPSQKEPLLRLMCSEFNVNYEWLTVGEGEMFVVSESDAKAEAMRQLTEAYNLDKTAEKWLNVLLSVPPEHHKALKALALWVAEKAAELNDDAGAGEEIVADARIEHDEMMEEYSKGLTLEEELELVYRRHENAKKGAFSSMILEKHGSDAMQKSSKKQKDPA